MVERRSSTPPEDPPNLEAGLHIDRDDLNGSLTEQPDRFYKVALAYSEASSLRDAAKLELEQIEANLDVSIRAEAAKAQEKTTEASIKQEMRLDPRWQEAKNKLLDLSLEVDKLGALKEAFQQRSYMLKELVALAVSELGSRSGAAGAYEARARQAQEAIDARAQNPRRFTRRRSEED